MDKPTLDHFLSVSKRFFLEDTDKKNEEQWNWLELAQSNTKKDVLRILLIEDDVFIIWIIKDFVEDYNWEVVLTVISTISDVISILNSQQHFDYVFLDWNIWWWNTWELSSEIAKNFYTISITECNVLAKTHVDNWAKYSIPKDQLMLYIDRLKKR